MRAFLFRASCAALIFIFPQLSHGDEPQQWGFLNSIFHKSEVDDFTLTLHGRLYSGDEVSLYQIQPRYAHKITEWFWLAGNYSFLGVDDSAGGSVADEGFDNQHRLEVELQPRIDITKDWYLTGRNRFEYAVNEDFDYRNHRFRHRTTLRYDGYAEHFASMVSQVEVFYGIHQSRWNQVRSSPFGLKFPVFGVSLTLLPTMLSLYEDGAWENSFVATLELGLDFS